MSMLSLFTLPFVYSAIICALIIAAIHAYLGFHIVGRGVIFVDLSLAQAAALGAILAAVLGAGGPLGRYALSLAFTFLAAAVIAVARTRDERVPQEAFIGIVYVGCAALTILVLAHRPGGMEELQHMLAGSLLTVTGAEILKLAAIFGSVGILHLLARRRFFTLTTDRARALRLGWHVTWWDFLFYASVGVVVTSAVPLAGVLLVFSFLVIPPVSALLLTTNPWARLLLGWATALMGSVVGIAASVAFNLPTGPSIISALVAIMLLAALVNAARGGMRSSVPARQDSIDQGALAGVEDTHVGARGQ